MTTSVLMVGAGSRLARVTRRHFSSLKRFTVSGLVRRPEPVFPREALHLVHDYFAPHPALLQTAHVVNFAGISGNAPHATLKAANVDGPLRLARAARDAGARQFITISTSHVYGRARLIRADTPENPVSSYGRSKKQADDALLTLAHPSFIVTILRIPMVYGPELGESLMSLARLSGRMGFLPSPPVPVRRSLLHAENFAHALGQVIDRNLGGVVRLADPEPLSFALLAEMAAHRCGRQVRLVRWLNPFLRPLLALKPALHDRLYADCIFQQEDCLKPDPPYPIVLHDGLSEFLA
jgi:UDP-glucose 4-epimerase